MIKCIEDNGTNETLFAGLRDRLCSTSYQADLR
jgi:hypothetical protein